MGIDWVVKAQLCGRGDFALEQEANPDTMLQPVLVAFVVPKSRDFEKIFS